MKLRLFLAAGLLCSAASATILTFKMTGAGGGALSTGMSIPATYGDNVSLAPDELFRLETNDWRGYYEMGNAWTPGITADWFTRSEAAPFAIYAGKTVGYSNAFAGWASDRKEGAIIDVVGNYFAELVLTAEAGQLVQLNGFRLRSRTGPVDSLVSINGVDTNVAVAFDNWVDYTPAETIKAQSVTIRWGFGTGTDNVAISNINFDQVSAAVTQQPDPETATPEPGTMLIAGSALVGLALYRRGK